MEEASGSSAHGTEQAFREREISTEWKALEKAEIANAKLISRTRFQNRSEGKFTRPNRERDLPFCQLVYIGLFRLRGELFVTFLHL